MQEMYTEWSKRVMNIKEKCEVTINKRKETPKDS